MENSGDYVRIWRPFWESFLKDVQDMKEKLGAMKEKLYRMESGLEGAEQNAEQYWIDEEWKPIEEEA